jgi:hypothetical protein
MAANRTALGSPSQERFLRFFFNLGFSRNWLAGSLKMAGTCGFALTLRLLPPNYGAAKSCPNNRPATAFNMKAVTNSKFQQCSIRARIWFGARWSESSVPKSKKGKSSEIVPYSPPDSLQLRERFSDSRETARFRPFSRRIGSKWALVSVGGA